jgi:hypothetical protein
VLRLGQLLALPLAFGLMPSCVATPERSTVGATHAQAASPRAPTEASITEARAQTEPLARAAAPVTAASASVVNRPGAHPPQAPGGSGDGEAIARMLPPDSERCSVAQPTQVAPTQRALLSLVSQTEPLPWSLAADVVAYARAERTPSLGPRAVVELVRFARADRASIERALTQALARPLVWQDADAPQRDGCQGELTCRALQARFVDPRTVQLGQGAWGEHEAGPSPCLEALRMAPDAIEVSARAALLRGSELRDSRTRLEHAAASQYGLPGVVRITERRYAGPEQAERALHDAWLGHDELATLAGVPASSLGERAGDVLQQRAFVSYEDLQLMMDDRSRASALREQASEPPSIERVDPGDAEAVRALYDAQLPRLSAHRDPAALAALAQLLERARAQRPDDAGLARRHYQLALTLRGDARAAYAIAREARTRKLAEPLTWQLRARAALAQFDEPALRRALVEAHALTAAQALRIARLLTLRVRSGTDYERAEWAQLSALRLGRAAARLRRVRMSLHIPLLELPRLLAYLAQSELPQRELGLTLRVTAEHLRPADDDEARRDLPWVEDTPSSAGATVLLAATTGDDAQLHALASALARRSDDGRLELVVAFGAIGAGPHATALLAGRREGALLLVEQLSSPLARVDWRRVERLLGAPLRALVGATFPPDELAIEAYDPAEATQIATAAQAAAQVTCSFDGPVVRCRGRLSDVKAARRALLGVTAALLRDEARALWSGTD